MYILTLNFLNQISIIFVIQSIKIINYKNAKKINIKNKLQQKNR